ncbi:hypothetical protein AB0D62_37850 [Streptomyces massasporeus]|uniref:hypothetical protein n=1 Tax=Streptomyces massasporeus TaxID=67324 RepID=UPI0033D7023C
MWAAGQAHRASGRRAVALCDGRLFVLVNPGGITDPAGGYADAHLSGFDDSGWRETAVPDDWSIGADPHHRAGTPPAPPASSP